eukprot:192575_1
MARDYNYNLHVCDVDVMSVMNESSNAFIFEVVLDELNNEHHSYITSIWYSVELTRYSADVAVTHANYSQCVHDIMSSQMNNETLHHGLHFCSILDTNAPTMIPTLAPSYIPSRNPTIIPTKNPTLIPSHNPTLIPSYIPSRNPTIIPTKNPTLIPSHNPTLIPSYNPSFVPSYNPTLRTTGNPTFIESMAANTESVDGNKSSHNSANVMSSVSLTIIICLSTALLCCGAVLMVISCKYKMLLNKNQGGSDPIQSIQDGDNEGVDAIDTNGIMTPHVHNDIYV